MHRDRPNPSSPHSPVKAARSTGFPVTFPLGITKLHEAGQALRDPATEGGVRGELGPTQQTVGPDHLLASGEASL